MTAIALTAMTAGTIVFASALLVVIEEGPDNVDTQVWIFFWGGLTAAAWGADYLLTGGA